MKITGIKAIPVRWQEMGYEIWDSQSRFSGRQAVLIRVETDEGIVGWGESAFFGGPLEVIKVIVEKELIPFFMGKDPFMSEQLWETAYNTCVKNGRRGAVVAALSGIDIALWDIKGKACSLPVYKLLGGCRDAVEGYASAGFYADGKDAAALAEEMLSYKELGYRTMKLKVGWLDKFTDLDRVLAVKEAIGLETPLAIDANNNWDLNTAKWFAYKLRDMNIAWIEEPLAIESIDASAELCRWSCIPIGGYEQETTKFGFAPLIAKRAVNIVQPDVIWSGGFTEVRKIAAMAEAAGMICMPHSFSTGICLAANLQFLASVQHGMLEMDQNFNPLRDELICGGIGIDEHSMVHMPEFPGLGVEIDEDVIARYTVEL